MLLMVCFGAAGQLSKDLGYTRSFKGYGYVDTTAANTGGAAKSFAYLITYGDGIKFWLRNAENNRWIGIGMSSGSPSLQQVTTTGNSTTDSLIVTNSTGSTKVVKIYSYPYIGGSTGSGIIELSTTSPGNIYTQLSYEGIRWIRPGGIGKLLTFNDPAALYNTLSNLPDTPGTLASHIKINGTTYGANVRGVVDLGTIGGGSYTAGNGIKFDGSTIRWADTLFTSTSMDGNNYAGSLSYWQLNSFNVNSLSGSLGNNTGISIGQSSTYGGFTFKDNFADRGISSFYNFGTNNYGRFRVQNSNIEAIYMNAGKQAGMYVFNNGSNNVVTSFFADSIRFRHSTTGKYQPSAESTAKYKVVLMDSATGALVTTSPTNISGYSGSNTAGTGIRIADGKVSLKDTIDYALNIELRDTADIDGIRNPAISWLVRDTVEGNEVQTSLFNSKNVVGLQQGIPETGYGAGIFVTKEGFQLNAYRPADPYYKQYNIQARDTGINVQYNESRIDLHRFSLDLSAPEGGTLKLFNNSTTDVKTPYSKITNDATGKRLMLLNGVNADVELINPDSLGGGTNKVNTMEVVGDLLNLSSIPAGAERNYFSTSGSASIATSSNELVLNGIATVATSNIVNVPLDMASERWTQKIRIRCNVTTGTQRVGLGTRPSNRAGINRGFSYTFDAGSGVDKGKGFVFTGNGATFTQRAVSAALPLSNNDVVELTVERNGYTFNCKSKNITTGDSVTISYEYPVTSTAEPVMLPTSRPAIYQLNQANQTVLSWSFVEQTPTNPYLLIIGDSKTAGHNATAASGRFVNQLQSAHPDSVFAFTGYGDELNDAVKWLYLIKRVKPKNVVIALGSNDIRNTQTELSIAENLSRIVEACKFINADVYFLGLGENTINQSYLWQFANATLGSSKMITAYPTLAGDGVHLLDNASHTTVKQAIEAKLF